MTLTPALLQQFCVQLESARLREASDAELLALYLDQGEPTPFRLLLQRHAGLVWAVAHRVLQHHQDTEDVFQATFLLLARKAASIRDRSALASWLHGVATRLALRLKAQRRRALIPATDSADGASPGAQLEGRELQQLLDEELQRLPEKYRLPLILCYLQDHTHEEIAQQLSWPLGTVRGRMARARDLLRRRLERRGVLLALPAVGVLLAACSARAAVSVELLAQTGYLAVGTPAAARVLSPQVAWLLEDSLASLVGSSLRRWVALCLTLMLGGLGVGVLGSVTPPKTVQATPIASAEPPLPPASDNHGDPLPVGALGRLGSTRYAHGQEISALAFSPDGKVLVVGGIDRAITLIDARSGKVIRRLEKPDAEIVNGSHRGVLSLIMTPDGKQVAVVDRKGAETPAMLRILDVATGAVRAEVTLENLGSKGGIPLAISPEGKLLAVGGSRKQPVLLLETATGRVALQLHGFSGIPTGLAFSPDGKTLATSISRDPVVHLWSVATGKERAAIPGSRGGQTALAFSRDGKYLAATSLRGLRVWNLGAGQEILALGESIFGQPEHVQFSPDGKLLLVAATTGCHLVDVARQKVLRSVSTTRSWGIPSARPAAAFSPDGKTLAFAQRGGQIALQDPLTGVDRRLDRGHRAGITALAFSPEGHLAASGSWDRTIHLWDVHTRKSLHRLEGHAGAISALAFSPDGKLLASASTDKDDVGVHLWETKTGRRIALLPVRGILVTSLAFTVDSKQLGVGGINTPLEFWDVATQKVVQRIGVENAEFWAFLCNKDGKSLHTMGFDVGSREARGLLATWDLATGKSRATFEIPFSRLARFSPDGRLLAATGIVSTGLHQHEMVTTLYEVTRARPVGTITEALDRSALAPQLFARQSCMAFSPEGACLALPGKGGTILLWDVKANKERARLAGHGAEVHALAWSPDGKLLLSGSLDGTIHLWPAGGKH